MSEIKLFAEVLVTPSANSSPTQALTLLQTLATKLESDASVAANMSKSRNRSEKG